MRYTLQEIASLKVFAQFRTGDTVTIDVYDRTNNDAEVLTDDTCDEIGATGIFEWSFADLQTQPAAPTQYVWVMTNQAAATSSGTIYAGGYPDDIGSPISLSGGEETLAGMLASMSDYMGGLGFDSTTDSLMALAETLGIILGVADNIQLQTDQLDFVGTDVKATLDGEEVSADVVKISGDSGAADALEGQFDGTGLTGATFPSRQDQLDNIVLTGSAVNVPASGFVLTTGSEVGGTTYLNTFARDGVYHQLTDNAGTLDCYYEYQITADGVPTSITLAMAVTGNNDDIKVYGYDWVAPGWVQLGTVAGVTGLLIVDRTFPMFTTMAGTGADVGKVRIRLYNTGLTSSNAYVDLGFCSYSVVNRSVGYSMGAVWVDTIAGVAGTTPYINGTADNPVLTWADALTIATAMGLRDFRLAGGTSIQLTANSDYYSFHGPEATIDLNGQSIAAAFFDGPYVFGVATGDYARFIDCKVGNVTLGQVGMGRCALAGTITASAAGQYILEGCFSAAAGGATPVFDFGGAVGDTNCNIRHHSGRIEIQNLGRTGTDDLTFEGHGELILNANCTGGSATIRGVIELEDNSGGAVTIDEEARLDCGQVEDSVWDGLRADHTTATTFGGGVKAESLNTQAKADVNAEVDTALSDIALDRFFKTVVVGADVVNGSVISKLVSKATPPDWDTFDHATDSLEALSDAINLLSPGLIADAVWDELLAGHIIAGSAGDALANAGGIDLTEIEDLLNKITEYIAAILDEIEGTDSIGRSTRYTHRH